ncbi:MAG: hypothetical protein ACJ8F7_18060, partial [Gemmataceae bacterium]
DLDPFDLTKWRLSQDFGASLGVKKVLLSVPIRKPDKSWFVRVHPSEEFRQQTAVIELKEERGSETFLVAPALWPALSGESTFTPKALFLGINRQGNLFVWPARLPGADGKLDEWSRTALEAADMAMKRWVRVQANMPLGAYDVCEAHGELPEPEWPDLSFGQILKIAFKDRIITTLDHAVLRKLRGEV